MSKICKQCGQLSEESASFCTNCGSKDFSVEPILQPQQQFNQQPQQQFNQQPQQQFNQQPQQQFNQQPQQQFNQQPQQQFNQQPQQQFNQPPINIGYQPMYQPPQKKKGLKWWHILLIVLGALLVVFLVIGIFANSSDNSSKTKEDSSSYSDDTSSKTKTGEYSKGKIKGDYYINEWANLKLKITDDFPDTPNKYSEFENLKVDAGFISSDTLTGKQLLIRFEDLGSSVNSASSDKLLEMYIKSFKENSEKAYEKQGVKTKNIKESDKKIGGKTYKTLSFTFDNNSLKEIVCIRIEGSHSIIIDMTSLDEDDFDTAFSLMSAVD